jgi:hypothetical protein
VVDGGMGEEEDDPSFLAKEAQEAQEELDLRGLHIAALRKAAPSERCDKLIKQAEEVIKVLRRTATDGKPLPRQHILLTNTVTRLSKALEQVKDKERDREYEYMQRGRTFAILK